jgi:hypothetical protein
MSAVRETNANAALARAVAMAEAAADALNEVPMDCLQGSGLGELLTRLRAVQRRIDASGALLGHRFAGCDEWIRMVRVARCAGCSARGTTPGGMRDRSFRGAAPSPTFRILPKHGAWARSARSTWTHCPASHANSRGWSPT